MVSTEVRSGMRDDGLAEPLSPHGRILHAAAKLLAEGGREAVSTRAVSAAAGVQPPTIYRQFGDMQGLLDAVAEEGFARHLRDKIALVRTDDPLADVRAGWDAHVGFGLANPALYALMYSEPRTGAMSSAAIEAQTLLEDVMRRMAEAGMLRVGVDRAARMIHAAAVGVVLTLTRTDAADRDLSVSSLTREAILAAITTDTRPAAGANSKAGLRRATAYAVALQAVLPEVEDVYTPAERDMLAEWLDRLILAT